MLDGPLNAYRAKRGSGELRPDSAQALAAEKLQSLANALRHYQPALGQNGWKDRLGLGRRRIEPPQGLYLFGDVGRGKSMLMDLFFEAAPAPVKRRVHFHAFMAEIQDRLHRWRQDSKGEKSDPLPKLAAELAREAWLICFDEFHVVNIADAMILGRLFEGLFKAGVVVVATSNFPPDRLYEGGLQRENFLPFLDIMKQRMDILELDGGLDYRLRHLQHINVYHTPLDAAAAAAMADAFAQLTAGSKPRPSTIKVKARQVAIPLAARGVARFTFADLCDTALGAGDYLAIARQFHTVLLAAVPALSKEMRNEARRFMTLVDTLYEHKVNLVISAEVEPAALYPAGDGVVEFQRTVSRLMEMRSKQYIAAAHVI